MTAKKVAEVAEAKKALDSRLEIIGNLVHDSVPVNNDEVYRFLSYIIQNHCEFFMPSYNFINNTCRQTMP